MTTFLSFLTLMTLTTGPILELIREIMKNWSTIMAASIEPGKQMASQHHKIIITYWFSKVTFLPAAKKSVPMHMSSYCSKKIASV